MRLAQLRTDPEFIARLAAELGARLRGARVRDVGRLADGRTAILLWLRGHELALCVDLFATPPLVTLEEHELPIQAEPGFIRALGAALRGSTLLAADARKGDRLLRLTFGTRSRFGIGDESIVYVELVPRFGNVVLVRNERIVAAAKEFSLAENPARAVQAGQPYSLPPLVARAGASPTPIPQEGSVLEVMLAHRNAGLQAQAGGRLQEQRRALTRRIEERATKVRAELGRIASQRSSVSGRDRLRERGEQLLARLHEFEARERDEAKAEAKRLFARYKKLGASAAHLDGREQTLRATLEALDQLQWEAERTDDVDLRDVEDAFAHLGRHTPRQRAVRNRKRVPLEVRTTNGSRILVGRSPSENAELTFRTARPNDWWFHAQGVPGAHVILQRDARGEPPADDIERAASLAAFFSKARASGKVAIDYTLRKYVRAQRDAPPGLVWYTNPQTIVVTPRSP